MTELLIRGGRVIDGTGAPSRSADVRVQDGRIVEVGSSLAPLGEVLSVDGAIVSPGFIDCHTHFDASLFWDPRCDPMPEHGVTTVLIGNCSLGLAPVTSGSQTEIADVFSYIEDIPRELFTSMVPWDWQTYPEYARALSARHFALNVVGLVPHSWLRTFVMGPHAWQRAATEREVAAIAQELTSAMEAGALGLSTSLFDRDSGGRLVPSALADNAELDALFRILHEAGGIAQLIPRHPELAAIHEDLQRFGIWARRYAVPLLVNAITDPIFDPSAAQQMLEWVTALQSGGAPVYPMLSPRSVDMMVNFFSSISFSRLPSWNGLIGSPVDEKRRLLTDVGWRARARADWDRCTSMLCPSKRLEVLRIVSVGTVDELSEWVGRNFADFAAERRGHPSDALADLVLETDLELKFVYPLTNQRPEVVGGLLRSPAVVVGASDAGAHFQAFCGSGDTTLLLTRHVRDRGDLSIEAAIHALTGRQATLMGLRDRGVIREGAIADLVVFELEKLKWLPDTLVKDGPGGIARLRRPPGGYRHTLVAGKIVQTNGNSIDVLPGRFLGTGEHSNRDANAAFPTPAT